MQHLHYRNLLLIQIWTLYVWYYFVQGSWGWIADRPSGGSQGFLNHLFLESYDNCWFLVQLSCLKEGFLSCWFHQMICARSCSRMMLSLDRLDLQLVFSNYKRPIVVDLPLPSLANATLSCYHRHYQYLLCISLGFLTGTSVIICTVHSAAWSSLPDWVAYCVFEFSHLILQLHQPVDIPSTYI